MKSTLTASLACLLLAACTSAENTTIPQDIEKMDSIKPAMEKLSPEDRTLVAGYIMRHTVGAQMQGLFGVKGDPIPPGMTIGKAIDEQKAFLAERQAEEAKQAA